MTDILKAKALFKKAGLTFPVLPKELALSLKERDEWLYSTRSIDISPYFINHYINEDNKTKIDDYAVLSNSGYGVNSYGIQYYLVYGPLRMFLFLGWGGVYMDKKKAAIQIKECFDLADKITAAASKKLMADSRLTVVVSDFHGNYWSSHDKSDTVILSKDLSSEKTPQQVLGEVLRWIDGMKANLSRTVEKGKRMTFNRAISNQEKVFENLRKHFLFKSLKKDILSGVVFPAIRNEVIDFYYCGQRLFHYKCKSNVFSTNIKFASVYDFKGDYISENELKNLKPICNFENPAAYKRIKENCSKFSGGEASGVSEVYSKYSILNEKNKSGICVLDIEISFKKENEIMDDGISNKGQDRIDLLVYNKKEGKLRFYEAKHFTNGELWSSKGTPKVIKQLERYNKQLHNKDILNVYQGYIKTLNSLFEFDSKISEPTELDVNVVLLVFGFDRNQLAGKLKPFLHGDKGYKDIPHYYVGNIKTVNMKSLWDEIKVGK